MSAPDPEGRGAREAMEAALADAGLARRGHRLPEPPRHRHAAERRRWRASPSTPSSARAAVQLDEAARRPHPRRGGRARGRLLLARAAQRREGDELAAAAHGYDGVRDQALPALHFASPGERAAVRGPARVMTNSFGFGGNNCTLVLGERVSATARVLGWAAWAPGLEDAAAWRAWAKAPVPLEREGVPDARFLPRDAAAPLHAAHAHHAARRIRRLPRGAARGGAHRLRLAPRQHQRVDRADRGRGARASRSRRPSSATPCTTPRRALFSIATGQPARVELARRPGRTPSASGWLEALAHLEREPARPLLLVLGDVPLAPTFAPARRRAGASYAVAWLLAAGDEGDPARLRARAASPSAASGRAWPDAAEWLRWWLSGEPRLELGEGARRFAWERA